MNRRTRTNCSLLVLASLLPAAAPPLPGQHPVEKYAFSFVNFRSDPCVDGSAFYGWDRYMETFIGIPAEPANNFGFDFAWYEHAYKTIGAKGNCFGMSLLSALIDQKGGHLGYCGPVNQYSGDIFGTKTHTCEDPDPDDGITPTQFFGPTDLLLRRAIEEMHGHQLNLANVRHSIEQFGKGYAQNAAIAFTTVEQEVSQGRPCLVSIQKNKDPFSGDVGHVLLAYDAVEHPSGDKRIYVYDSNRPWPLRKTWYDPDDDADYLDGENYITVDGDHYEYDMGGEIWPEDIGLIFAIPLSIAGPRDRTPASLGMSVGQLANDLLLSGGAGGGSAQLAQATGADGRTLFVPGTRLPQADPAKRLFSMGPILELDGLPEGLEGEPLERYSILEPPAGGLDLDVVSSGGYEMLLLSRGSRLAIRARDARGTDRVRIEDPGTLSPRVLLTNRAGAGEMEVEIVRPVDTTGALRNFRLRRISMPRGGLLEIGLGDGGKVLEVSSPVHETGFELELISRRDRTENASRLTPVVLGAGEEGSFEPEDWSDPSRGDIVPSVRGISIRVLEAYSDFLSGPGGGPAGGHFPHTRDIGGASGGRTVFDARSGEYTQISSGDGIGPGGDAFHFAHDVVEGDFELTVEVVERIGSSARADSIAPHGLMARKDSMPGAKYSFLETRLFGAGTGTEEEWPRWEYRRRHGEFETDDSTDDHQRFSYDPDQAPRFLKMVRRGRTFHGFLSSDGRDWRPVGSDTWHGEGAGSSILVGFASTSGQDAAGPSTVRFKVLGFGPIDPALEPLLPEGADPAGTEVYRNDFTGASASPPGAMRVSRRSGGFTPQVRSGKLRLTDESEQGSAVAAFAEQVIPDIDSAVYRFDFDLFLARRTGLDPGEGIAFVVTGGEELGRVGFAGGGLGLDLLGREVGTDRNASRTGFAVEIDTARGAGDAEGAGSPDAPRSYHVGIDSGGNIDTVVLAEEGLPDPFSPEGIHVRVGYNRGRVTVHLGPGGAGTEGLVKALSADLLPVSFAGLDESAVFGFTAATGLLAQTAEVDALVATRLECSDAPDVAIIEGAPLEPVAVGSIVTLDGSFSNGGSGDEEHPVSHRWRVVAGRAAIDGPDDGPTVAVKPLAEGEVAVELAASDGRCDDSATARATFEARAGIGNWLRCDSDGDGERNITDAIVTLGWLFLGRTEPPCVEALDCLDDGVVNITDPIYDLNYLFLGGPPPAAPYPACDTFEGCGSACRS